MNRKLGNEEIVKENYIDWVQCLDCCGENVYTLNDLKPGYVYDGDLLTCRDCGGKGIVDVSNEEGVLASYFWDGYEY